MVVERKAALAKASSNSSPDNAKKILDDLKKAEDELTQKVRTLESGRTTAPPTTEKPKTTPPVAHTPPKAPAQTDEAPVRDTEPVRPNRPGLSRRHFIILLCFVASVAFLSYVVFTPPDVTEQSISDIVRINEDAAIPIELSLPEGSEVFIEVNISVVQGPNIDVVLMTKGNYENMLKNETYRLTPIALNQSAVDTSFNLIHPGTYYLLIENGDRIPDGASPPGSSFERECLIGSYLCIPVYKEDINDPALVDYTVSIRAAATALI